MKKGIGKSAIKHLLLCFVCTLIVLFAGNGMSVSAKTVTKSITLGKGQTYTVEQSLSGKATYQTSNKKVATAKKGKITAQGTGSAKITIKDKKNTYVYKVKVAKVYLSKQQIVVNKDKSATLKVKGTSKKASWSSSNKKIATVNSSGKITAKKAGTVTITAKVGGEKLTCKVTVENPSMTTKVSLAKGKSSALAVKGTTQKVTWSSSNKKVVTVSSAGKITAKKTGTAAVSAKVNGTTLKCKVTVTNPTISAKNLNLVKGKTAALTVSGTKSSVTWATSNKNIAAVNSKGKVTAKAAGIATITAKVDGASLTCKVTVTNSSSASDNSSNTDDSSTADNTWCGIEWSLENGKLTLSGTYKETANFSFLNAPWADKCYEITSAKVTVKGLKSTAYMFNEFSSMTSVDLSGLDTSKVTDMGAMFAMCSSLASVDVSNFDTSNVTSMHSMFYWCGSLTDLDLSNFDTSNVVYMQNMFYECENLTNLNISSFDTSNVEIMRAMFYWCCNLTKLDVSKFNTSKTTDMSDLFSGCGSLTSLDVSNFDTSKVTSMRGMFNCCMGLTSLDLRNFNTAKVTDMNYMFSSCSNLKEILVGSKWVTAASNYEMFTDCGTSEVTVK